MTAPINFDSGTIREITASKRFLAADRAQLDIGAISTWDPYLLREHRLLVPVDVQALYVPPGSTEKMVRLPMLVAGANGVAVSNPEDGMPDPFDAGAPRPAGVHLHWAMPDALLRGTLEQRPAGAKNLLSLPVLPDRWVVLRFVLPKKATDVVITGWVLESDRAVAVPLGSWTEGGAASKSATPAGVALDPTQLTGTVGGSVAWSAVYDAVLNRFAFHDPLGDIAALVPSGADADCASYLVAGWWSNAATDALDSARSDNSLHELLDRLRWRLLYEWGDEQWALEQDHAQFELRKALGLTTSDRWSSPRPFDPGVLPQAQHAQAARATGSASGAFVPIDTTFMEKQPITASSAFATEAVERFAAQPWHLRSSLLHGVVYGVPVVGPPVVDRRPDSSALGVAIGQHDDDVLAAFAAAPQATTDQKRGIERLLAAFTSQKINRFASPDGIAELEEHEHAAAFTSRPGGSAGTDRYLQRVQTGGVGGLGLGRKRATSSPITQGGLILEATTVFSTGGKPVLVQATEMMVNDVARSRVGDVLAPTEARVVDRPAPRFTFPHDPLVAVRGASRSLRHGGDGRGSADGKLTCRWPTHVVSEISGIIPKERFVRSLGNGSIPPEITTLAREVVLHDPYHNAWIARAVTPAGGDGGGILRRLTAESVMRFGMDGTYDGATVAFNPTRAKTPAARRKLAAAGLVTLAESGTRQTQMQVADELLKFSLYKGVDPDLVGVTTWAQPWIPMWLEWEVKVEGLDPPTLTAWRLGSIDLEHAAPDIDGGTATLRGRAVLTTGAANTLHDAISDYLKAEDALDAVYAGLVDEVTEDALRSLDDAVRQLDIVTASLDGVRTQLLGLPVSDGLRRPSDGGLPTNPAPVAPPHGLLAGCVTLTKARLVDAFGRTLDVPVNHVVTPTRVTLEARPGALAVRPRLLRPARWRLRLVEASTAVGAEGVEGRVDQIEPPLQVNPVAGFVMPDHIDESLEVYSIDGSPIGELLHEPVSGGVMWEIAAGREGPADAGPLYGLAPAQQPLGRIAAGLVAADAAARAGAPLSPDGGGESALSALLRAIDTTLWTVDTFASLGSEHVAGLVGRPIAVVRAQLKLELWPPEDIDLSDPSRAAEWADVEREVSKYGFPIRIGELTRSDDGVLGFFVDDDFAHFRLVDKAIAGSATESGRSRGQLGLYATVAGMPPKAPIDHPYIVGTDDADTLTLHVGQSVTLTIFMHPVGKATLTSGLLPRDAIALARDWVGPGLAAIAPSLRTGPVLVETDLDTKKQVRLPKVSVFGKNQNFLWRETPATWRTDAILAATQTALLPDTPAELREGWIRVAPDTPTAPNGGTP
jgi:hypothetical protein